jgi:hypothetical protein
MKLTYIGPKRQHTFSFPIPYLSKGELEGEIIFERDKETEVRDLWGTRLLNHCPHLFRKPAQPQGQKG